MQMQMQSAYDYRVVFRGCLFDFFSISSNRKSSTQHKFSSYGNVGLGSRNDKICSYMIANIYARTVIKS